MQILYVENHRMFAQTVVNQFLSDHVVEVVADIRTAKQRIAQRHYDVTLIDYDLNDGKGTELVKHLRRTGHKIKIIAVSSHQEGNEALLKAGADAICSKMQFNQISTILEQFAT